MSTPSISHEDPIHGALNECISAISALNMEAEPIPDAEGYLSDTDAWAKHAMEHLHAVCELLRKAGHERDLLRGKLLRAGIDC